MLVRDQWIEKESWMQPAYNTNKHRNYADILTEKSKSSDRNRVLLKSDKLTTISVTLYS